MFNLNMENPQMKALRIFLFYNFIGTGSTEYPKPLNSSISPQV